MSGKRSGSGIANGRRSGRKSERRRRDGSGSALGVSSRRTRLAPLAATHETRGTPGGTTGPTRGQTVAICGTTGATRGTTGARLTVTGARTTRRMRATAAKRIAAVGAVEATSAARRPPTTDTRRPRPVRAGTTDGHRIAPRCRARPRRERRRRRSSANGTGSERRNERRSARTSGTGARGMRRRRRDRSSQGEACRPNLRHLPATDFALRLPTVSKSRRTSRILPRLLFLSGRAPLCPVHRARPRHPARRANGTRRLRNSARCRSRAVARAVSSTR